MFLKLYGKSWPKFKQVSKKVPTSRILELLDFDEKSAFDLFALFGGINQGSPYSPE